MVSDEGRPPQFLFDEDVANAIYSVIKEAKEYLYLVSPYNDHPKNLERALGDAVKRKGLRFEIFYRAEKDPVRGKKQDEGVAWLKGEGATVYPVEWLHAKIYVNESTALATSMNLLGSSFNNAQEFGVWVEKAQHGALYNQLGDYVRTLRERAERSGAAVSPAPAKPAVRPAASKRAPAARTGRSAPRAPAPTGGYCIRCRRGLALNPDRPYCLEHYKTWNEYQNYDYEEKYCHSCGKERKTSMKRPRCLDCFRSSPS